MDTECDNDDKEQNENRHENLIDSQEYVGDETAVIWSNICNENEFHHEEIVCSHNSTIERLLGKVESISEVANVYFE